VVHRYGVGRRFGLFKELWASAGFIFGGREAIQNTDALQAADPMFDDPPGCLMHRQGSFMVNFFPEGAEVGGEIGIFPFPGVGQGGSIVNPQFAVFFDDRPEIRALIDLMLAPDLHCDTVSLMDTVAAHLDTPGECHNGPIASAMAPPIQADLQLDNVRVPASDQMPFEVTGAFWAGMIDWVDNVPTETVLADIEAAWPAE
jgi:alpha-glucoside transport system substrate-binding protein